MNDKKNDINGKFKSHKKLLINLYQALRLRRKKGVNFIT